MSGKHILIDRILQHIHYPFGRDNLPQRLLQKVRGEKMVNRI